MRDLVLRLHVPKISVTAFAAAIFVDPAFINDFHAQRPDSSDLVLTPWQPEQLDDDDRARGSTKASSSSQRFNTKVDLPTAVKKVLGITKARITLQQRFATSRPDDSGRRSVWMVAKLSSRGVPLSSYMCVDHYYTVEPDKAGTGCMFEIRGKYVFSGLAVLRGMIENTMYKESFASQSFYMECVTKWVDARMRGKSGRSGRRGKSGRSGKSSRGCKGGGNDERRSRGSSGGRRRRSREGRRRNSSSRVNDGSDGGSSSGGSDSGGSDGGSGGSGGGGPPVTEQSAADRFKRACALASSAPSEGGGANAQQRDEVEAVRVVQTGHHGRLRFAETGDDGGGEASQVACVEGTVRDVH